MNSKSEWNDAITENIIFCEVKFLSKHCIGTNTFHLWSSLMSGPFIQSV